MERVGAAVADDEVAALVAHKAEVAVVIVATGNLQRGREGGEGSREEEAGREAGREKEQR